MVPRHVRMVPSTRTVVPLSTISSNTQRNFVKPRFSERCPLIGSRKIVLKKKFNCFRPPQLQHQLPCSRCVRNQHHIQHRFRPHEEGDEPGEWITADPIPGCVCATSGRCGLGMVRRRVTQLVLTPRRPRPFVRQPAHTGMPARPTHTATRPFA